MQPPARQNWLVAAEVRDRDGVDRAPPRIARPFVYGFLAAFVLTTALAIEWWPFTGWKLFSQVRTGSVSGWQVVTVDGDGEEHPIDFEALPRGFRGWYQVAGLLPTMSDQERLDVLRTWASAAEEAGADVREIRVYRTTAPVRTDFDRPSPPVTRELRYHAAGAEL
jgi:hypothetical protein